MASRRDFDEELRFILNMHNLVRGSLFPDADEAGHFINENTVVRVAALIEEHGLKPLPPDKRQLPAKGAEVHRDTIFLLRHCILHQQGYYRPSKIKRKDLIPAYEEFYKLHPEAKVADGKRLCLAAKEVLEPLVDGCIKYWKQQGSP